MTPEDEALDKLWRERFGEPLPILGAGEHVKEALRRAARQTTTPKEPRDDQA